jgi:SAM-dependent methyltransferase
MEHKTVRAFYNDVMPAKFGDDYEYRRWFSTPLLRAGYMQTKTAIDRHVLHVPSLDPSRILELGPGAGTWTKLLAKRFPDAYIDLLDISSEMLRRASRSLEGHHDHISLIESDILDFENKGSYDFFFSSRVLEYIEDKESFAKKIHALLSPGGKGFLITKMPHYGRQRLLGRMNSKLHEGQIAPQEFKALLSRAGFIDIDCYPVTISVPVLHSPRANFFLGNRLAPRRITHTSSFFAESYAVKFTKPNLDDEQKNVSPL